MKRILFGILAFMLLLSACASPATSASSPTPDTAATIASLSQTMVAATLAAQPTATQPPTETPTLTPPPLPTDTPTPTATLTPTETVTPQAFIGCFAPAGVGNVPMGIFRIENNTKETLRVYLNGVSMSGDKSVSCSFVVNASFNTEIIFGNYEYSVQIGQKRTLDGKFTINNDDKTTMRVYMTKVVVVGP
jgi:hypothetical protein